ncbi:MAG TPA: hypothetical protein VGK32_14010, partial [Vicinamibacterales bacterium]
VVTVPNGGLWSPYRAIPNGQGGLLVQLIRRLVWPGGDYWRWDAVVVGVDESGALTGSTALGADWGEIVVGENGTIVATSQVEYSTEPSWGGGAKRHVGMLMPLQANGNPGGLASFYGPSGSCGWIWDNIGQQWFYNGDCGQPVLSITSVAARGSDVLVTLNDGQVLAPGPLGQMRLSYLVPATDGTYLGGGAGAGTNGDLVNITVTSEEPASPFAPWSAGGNPAYAFAAAVPYIVQVDFQTGYCGSSNEWRVGACPGDVLSSSEQALVRSVTLQAMRDAYQGYDVTFTTGNPSAPRHIHVTETVSPDVPHSEIAPPGYTPRLKFESDVYFPNVWSTLMSVIGCPTLADACLQTKNLSRGDVLRAFGRGMGNTAAHELGHQPPYFFTADIVNEKCTDCYDSQSAAWRAHFFGPLHWSDFAKNKMRFLVSNK